MLDSQQWTMLGRYEIAVEDDAKCIWASNQDGFFIQLLIVGLHYFL